MKILFNRFVVLGITVSTLISPVAYGKTTPKKASFQRYLAVGGTGLLTLRGDSQESIDMRIETLQLRLTSILSDSNLQSADVKVHKTPVGLAIFVKSQLFITIMAEDSAFNQISQSKQAQIWSNSLAEALPQVKVLAHV